MWLLSKGRGSAGSLPTDVDGVNVLYDPVLSNIYPALSGTHLVSIHFSIGSVRLNRLVTARNSIDKFLSFGRVTRSNRRDFMNNIVHGTPA